MVVGGLAALAALCVGAVWRAGTLFDERAGESVASATTTPPVDASTSTSVPLATSTAAPTSVGPATTPVPATSVAAPPTTEEVPTTSEASTPATTTDAPATTAPTSVPPAMPSVTIAASTGGLTISGAVFGIVERAALVTTAEEALGAGAVDASQLTVVEGDTSAGDAQVAAAVRFLFLIPDGLQIDTIVLEGGVLAVAGTATSASLTRPVQAASDAARADGVTVVVDIAGLGGTP